MQNPDFRPNASSDAPSVTVIVCTRGRPDLLDQCLNALSGQTHPNYDVLVVDNDPGPIVREICGRWHTAWVPAPVPGLTKARNVGARAARGDLIAYIDDDATVEAGWLEALVEDFCDTGTSAVTGAIRYMNSVGDSRAMTEDQATTQGFRPRASFDRETPRWFSLACFGGIGDGGNMAFRRDELIAAGGFDERLGRGRQIDGGDEHVAFASIIARGSRINHRPDAVVRHPYPCAPSLQKARRYADLRSSIAYLLFLWRDFPAHHADVCIFLCRAILRRAIPGSSMRNSAQLLSWRGLAAVFGGILLYFRASREATSGQSVRPKSVARTACLIESHSPSNSAPAGS